MRELTEDEIKHVVGGPSRKPRDVESSQKNLGERPGKTAH